MKRLGKKKGTLVGRKRGAKEMERKTVPIMKKQVQYWTEFTGQKTLDLNKIEIEIPITLTVN